MKTLSDIDIATIQQSFLLLDKQGLAFAALFYDCLFNLAPLIKPMFKSDRKLMEKHFYTIFCEAVENIAHPDIVEPILVELGRRHYQYDVKYAQFSVVKTALLLTIQHELKCVADSPIEVAWGRYYDILADQIMVGMNLEKTKQSKEPLHG